MHGFGEDGLSSSEIKQVLHKHGLKEGQRHHGHDEVQGWQEHHKDGQESFGDAHVEEEEQSVLWDSIVSLLGFRCPASQNSSGAAFNSFEPGSRTL